MALHGRDTLTENEDSNTGSYQLPTAPRILYSTSSGGWPAAGGRHRQAVALET